MIVEIVKGRKWVKRAMRATQGKFGEVGKLNDKTFLRLLIAKHSVIEEYELWIDAEVPERVHTHIIRHKEVGKYVATSRPDINNSTQIDNGVRKLSLRINAKRLIEIMEQRLCKKSWHETTAFFEQLVSMLKVLDPVLGDVLYPPCVKVGYCTETKRTCGYSKTKNFANLRDDWLYFIKSLSEEQV